MDVEEFYEQDPRRQTSDEIEFGRDWLEGEMRFEVVWVADTGELFAMAEPVSRRGITTASVTVEILAIVEGRDAIDACLSGWEDAMSRSGELAWVREHVAGRDDSGSTRSSDAS